MIQKNLKVKVIKQDNPLPFSSRNFLNNKLVFFEVKLKTDPIKNIPLLKWSFYLTTTTRDGKVIIVKK